MVDQIKPKRIRVAMEQDEHDCVRLAAAMRREPMTEFCRQVILTEARRLVDGVPAKQGTPKKRAAR